MELEHLTGEIGLRRQAAVNGSREKVRRLAAADETLPSCIFFRLNGTIGHRHSLPREKKVVWSPSQSSFVKSDLKDNAQPPSDAYRSVGTPIRPTAWLQSG